MYFRNNNHNEQTTSNRAGKIFLVSVNRANLDTFDSFWRRRSGSFRAKSTGLVVHARYALTGSNKKYCTVRWYRWEIGESLQKVKCWRSLNTTHKGRVLETMSDINIHKSSRDLHYSHTMQGETPCACPNFCIDYLIEQTNIDKVLQNTESCPYAIKIYDFSSH